MSQYATWTVGGVTVPHVREVNKNQKEGIITLSCSALRDNLLTGDDDPRDEIARFEALTSQYINNEPLLNGGTKLQIGNGQIITVTDSYDTWTRCALESVEIKEDNKSEKRIDYDLIIHYELDNPGGSYVYTPSYDDYANIDYYYFYDPGPPEVKTEDTGDLNGTEIGWMQITETKNVSRVEVYGCGCELPATITVNDVPQLWHYGEVSGTPFATGAEKLTWDLVTPTTVVTVKSFHTLAENHGSWPMWIRVIYE